MNLKEILKAIKRYDSFLISTHTNPDPDALSSELAMAMLLHWMEKKVVIVNQDHTSKRYQFLPGVRAIKEYKKNMKVDYEAVLVVDCGDLERIGDVVHLIQKGKTIINIDHHITNDRFGDVNCVLPKACSTAEILYLLLKEAGFILNKNVALLLYLGIMTDTGSFRYDNTTSLTHQIVSDLLKFKFSVAPLYQRLYETIPLRDLEDFTKVINRFEAFKNGKVVFINLYKKDMKRFSEEFDARDTIFKFLRSIREVEVLAIFTEVSAKETRVNLRSTKFFDVAKLAHRFQGGGHQRASGCKILKTIPRARQALMKEIEKAL